MKNVQKGAIAAAVLGMTASMFVITSSAQAAQSSCSSSLHKEVKALSPDVYRASASCSAVEPNKKARAQLVKTGIDTYSEWFTRLNTTYYTNWTNYGTGSAVQIASI